MRTLLPPPTLSGDRIEEIAASTWADLLERLEEQPALTSRQAARIAALVEDYTRDLIKRILREE